MEPVILNADEMLKWKHNGQPYLLHCMQDDDAESPIEEEENVHLWCMHPKYQLGNMPIKMTIPEFWDYLMQQYCPTVNTAHMTTAECREALSEYLVITNLFLYDHSGLSIACGDENPFQDRFDSGQVGYAYMEKTDSMDSEAIRKQIKAVVQMYDQYLSGEVYGLKLVTKQNGDWIELDSCWGFYDSDVTKTAEFVWLDYDCGLKEALESGDYEIKPVQEKVVRYYAYDE